MAADPLLAQRRQEEYNLTANALEVEQLHAKWRLEDALMEQAASAEGRRLAELERRLAAAEREVKQLRKLLTVTMPQSGRRGLMSMTQLLVDLI